MRVLSFLVLLATSGCTTTRMGDFSMIANQNVQVPMRMIQKDVRGKACAAASYPSVEAAIEDAQRKAGAGDALTNVTLDFETQFWVLFVVNCIHVRGDVVSLSETASPAANR